MAKHSQQKGIISLDLFQKKDKISVATQKIEVQQQKPIKQNHENKTDDRIFIAVEKAVSALKGAESIIKIET